MPTPAIPPSLTVTDPSQAPKSGSVVNKDDFLKLLVAQLSHQDPLQPQSDTAFVAQLAQFAQLEQAQNQTTLLTTMQGQLASQIGAQAVSLVGRQITAKNSTPGQPDIKGQVTGVSFADGRPVLLIGDTKVQLGDVLTVSK